MNDEEYVFPKVEITVNGKSIKAKDLWQLMSKLEAALKDADVLDYDDSLEILSKEASAVVSKCGY